MEKTQWEAAKLDPTSVFHSPAELMAREDLSDPEKIELLRRWEYDARELEVAEEENMGADSPNADILHEILDCLRALNASHDPDQLAPTKQSGN